jgi:hypothetical protein
MRIAGRSGLVVAIRRESIWERCQNVQLTVRNQVEACTLVGCYHNRLESPDLRSPLCLNGGSR